MAKSKRNNRHPSHANKPVGVERSRPGNHARHSVSAGRYDAPGDDAMAIDSQLALQVPFRFGQAFVSRLKRRDVNVKEAFTLRDASGSYFRASLRELTEQGGLALPYEKMARSPEPVIDITLACSVLARQRMIFVMQKATELGVMRVVPLLTDHSVQSDGLEHERANAWPAQVVRAAKQCRRGSLPAVLPPTALDAFLGSAIVADADECVILDDQEDLSPAPANPPRRVVLFVGPEGGFSDAERAKLAGRARPWFLGGRIFRAETAVLVGLTAVHMRWGDFAR